MASLFPIYHTCIDTHTSSTHNCFQFFTPSHTNSSTHHLNCFQFFTPALTHTSSTHLDPFQSFTPAHTQYFQDTSPQLFSIFHTCTDTYFQHTVFKFTHALTHILPAHISTVFKPSHMHIYTHTSSTHHLNCLQTFTHALTHILPAHITSTVMSIFHQSIALTRGVLQLTHEVLHSKQGLRAFLLAVQVFAQQGDTQLQALRVKLLVACRHTHTHTFLVVPWLCCVLVPVSWRPTTTCHFTIGTPQTEYHEALPSLAAVQSHLTSSFANDGNPSWYLICWVPMVEWWVDYEDCHHLTIVGLHMGGSEKFWLYWKTKNIEHGSGGYPGPGGVQGQSPGNESDGAKSPI